MWKRKTFWLFGFGLCLAAAMLIGCGCGQSEKPKEIPVSKDRLPPGQGPKK